MTDRLFNALRQHAGALDAGSGMPRWGTVTSVDAANYTAKVMMQPEGVQTGWLPIVSPMVGAGWGLVCPPTIGQQLLVIPDLGDDEHGVILGGTWSTADRPPQPPTAPGGEAATVQPGEAALVHSTGTFIRASADGSAFFNIAGSVNVAAGGNATVTATGSVNILSPVIKLGASLADTLRGLCTELFYAWILTHVHSGVQTGGGNTGVPVGTPPSGSVTSVVTAE